MDLKILAEEATKGDFLLSMNNSGMIWFGPFIFILIMLICGIVGWFLGFKSGLYFFAWQFAAVIIFIPFMGLLKNWVDSKEGLAYLPWSFVGSVYMTFCFSITFFVSILVYMPLRKKIEREINSQNVYFSQTLSIASNRFIGLGFMTAASVPLASVAGSLATPHGGQTGVNSLIDNLAKGVSFGNINGMSADIADYQSMVRLSENKENFTLFINLLTGGWSFDETTGLESGAFDIWNYSESLNANDKRVMTYTYLEKLPFIVSNAERIFNNELVLDEFIDKLPILFKLHEMNKVTYDYIDENNTAWLQRQVNGTRPEDLDANRDFLSYNPIFDRYDASVDEAIYEKIDPINQIELQTDFSAQIERIYAEIRDYTLNIDESTQNKENVINARAGYAKSVFEKVFVTSF